MVLNCNFYDTDWSHYHILLVMGKAEGVGKNWHGHVTALTVAPEFRRLGLGNQLMDELEDISENR